MKICIVGGGMLAYFLSRSLLSKGHSLTIVNPDGEECQWFARRLRAVVVHGDGTHPAVMDDAEVGAADSVLAITPHDEDNYLVCQIARLRYDTPYVFALLNDPDNQRIFEELGITSAYSSINILSQLIEQRIGYDAVTGLTPLAEGRTTLTEILLPAGSPAVGRTVQELGLPEGCLIVSILRGVEAIIPKGQTKLRAADRVGVVSLPEVYAEVLAVLTGDRGL
jgi:trk system potassium uptake protein TrkA